jgi:hypothetical protein
LIKPAPSRIPDTVPDWPVAGQIYFNGTNFLGYNGTAWVTLG